MEFTNKQNADKDRQAVEDAMVQMSGLAKAVVSDGLNITVKQLWEITTGRLSLTKIYEDEAKGRTSKDPKYAQDNAVSIAKGQANKHQALVDSCRNYPIIGRWKAESFTMDENCNVSFVGDLKKECTSINTKTLTPKQEAMVKGIENFKKAFNQFNSLLTEAGKVKLNIEIPFTNHLGDPDLKEIAFVNHNAIQEKQISIERQIKADIEKKEKIRLRIESLVPKECEDREETVNRFILHELTTPREDEFYKNLLNPSKGNFKSKGVTLIGRTYEQ